MNLPPPLYVDLSSKNDCLKPRTAHHQVALKPHRRVASLPRKRKCPYINMVKSMLCNNGVKGDSFSGERIVLELSK